MFGTEDPTPQRSFLSPPTSPPPPARPDLDTSHRFAGPAGSPSARHHLRRSPGLVPQPPGPRPPHWGGCGVHTVQTVGRRWPRRRCPPGCPGGMAMFGHDPYSGWTSKGCLISTRLSCYGRQDGRSDLRLSRPGFSVLSMLILRLCGAGSSRTNRGRMISAAAGQASRQAPQRLVTGKCIRLAGIRCAAETGSRRVSP